MRKFLVADNETLDQNSVKIIRYFDDPVVSLQESITTQGLKWFYANNKQEIVFKFNKDLSIDRLMKKAGAKLVLIEPYHYS